MQEGSDDGEGGMIFYQIDHSRRRLQLLSDLMEGEDF
jgi:hypothetical protein